MSGEDREVPEDSLGRRILRPHRKSSFAEFFTAKKFSELSKNEKLEEKLGEEETAKRKLNFSSSEEETEETTISEIKIEVQSEQEEEEIAKIDELENNNISNEDNNNDNISGDIAENIGIEGNNLSQNPNQNSENIISVHSDDNNSNHTIDSVHSDDNNSIQSDTIDSVHSDETESNMAFTSTQYVDMIPKCTNESTVEQFISIVDTLYETVKDDDDKKAVFLAIVRSKILSRAFDVTKGKDASTWEAIKTNLVAGLEDTMDAATASNKLVQIRQNKNETLKEYIERIKTALADLDKISIRDNTNEEVKKHVLLLNDATAKNTFEFGLLNKNLKTIVVAAQKSSFALSHSFAINQEQTNFPEWNREQGTNKFNNKKKIVCYNCGKIGHLSTECRGPKRNNRSNNYSTNRYNGHSNTNEPSSSNNRSFFNNHSNNSNGYRNSTENSRSNNNSNAQATNNDRSQNNSYNNNNQSRYNSRKPNYDNRNKNNKDESRNVRVIRDNEVDWNDIVPTEIENETNLN